MYLISQCRNIEMCVYFPCLADCGDISYDMYITECSIIVPLSEVYVIAGGSEPLTDYIH